MTGQALVSRPERVASIGGGMTTVRGPVVIRRRLGAALKELRVARGLHLQAVAQQLEVSSSKLSRLETGNVAPRIRDVRDLLEIYQAPDEVRARILGWAQDAKQPGWWQPFSAAVLADLDLYISLEAEARKIRMYSIPVSGLLQTPAYAQMLLTGAAPYVSAEELNKLIEIRIGRQVVVDPDRKDAPPVELHVVLDEAALHRGTSRQVLEGQLTELLRRCRWPHVTMQILPFEAGFTIPTSTFAIFEPRDSRDGIVINVESAGQDAYFDTSGEIAKYENMWRDLLAKSLNASDSEAMVQRLLARHNR